MQCEQCGQELPVKVEEKPKFPEFDNWKEFMNNKLGNYDKEKSNACEEDE